MALNDNDLLFINDSTDSNKAKSVKLSTLKDNILEGSTSDTYVEVAGDNMTGDLTLGTDKITLDASGGSGTFAGGNVKLYDPGASDAGAILFSTSSGGTLRSKFQGTIAETGVYSYANSPITFHVGSSAEKVALSLASDLSATFAGNVTIGDMADNANAGITAGLSSKTAYINIKGDGTSPAGVFGVMGGGNQTSDYVAQINGDGSAEFATGKFKIDDRGTVTGPGSGGDYYSLGAFNNSGATTGSTGGRLVLKTDESGSVDTETIVLNGQSGSAEFSGIATAKGATLKPTDITGGLYVMDSSDSTKSAATITGNGSAEFKESVLVSGPLATTTGVQLVRQGQISVRRDDNALNVFEAFNGGDAPGDRVITFGADGSAMFKGAVQVAGGVVTPSAVLQLEADDDTKYTTTTDSEGVETRVYNGAVLDVKDRIQNVLARMDAIEANEITDDATDSALLTLIANLSARLDERDAAIAALTARIETLESY